MQRIQLLLTLFNIANPGNCSNNQVSVLKYKGGTECENSLVGVPMKYTSSMTFCGMYRFRFLQNSFLMGIEPDNILRIWDLSENVGILIHQGVTYKFYFPNQIVTPDSWQYICLAISPTLIKIAWNGEIVLSEPKLELYKEESTNSKLWLGGALFLDNHHNQRFEGMIAKANFWNDGLEDLELISITNNGQSVPNITNIDLLSVITHTKH